MKKHGMVPDHSFFEAMTTCSMAILPVKFYNKVEEGSIVLKKTKSFSFCKDGVIIQRENSPRKSDVVIFGTGFQGDQKLRAIFKSSFFRDIVAGSQCSAGPLYSGGFKLPSIKSMENDVIKWEKYMKRYAGPHFGRSSIGTIRIWYNDQLCRDMGCNPKRKKGFFADLLLPYGPGDYVGITSQK
ncbi:hypothetical protein LUZ61_020033 [Rhynchospora tenuis]|uniref:Flavin-containing monooxygenase n=1 Tax=Rhynchospora tenuis TaxID=198213 RepID=A0AAD5ZCK6_9POAL|nr:hypothetical protein LUZ61_020033 [Rhynchospora tenuis]